MLLIRCLASFALALLSIPAQAGDDASRVPIAHLTKPAQVGAMKLSPDGQWIAGIGWANRGHVLLIDAKTFAAKVLHILGTSYGNAWAHRPSGVNWISNDLLAVDFSDQASMSIDLEGRMVATLGERFIRRMPEKGDGRDLVLAYRTVADRAIDLVDARTGERSRFKVDLPGTPMAWAFDDAGALRAVTMMDTALWQEKTRIRTWYRPDERSAWVMLNDVSVNDDYWLPIRALPENGSLAVASRHERDTWAVFRYDVGQRRFGDMMAGHPTQDILRVAGLEQSTFKMVVTGGIKPQVYWFDAQWAQAQAAADAAIPGRINVLQGNADGRFVITSYGDVDPGRFFLLDMKSQTLREFAQSVPDIDPRRMRPMETVSYPTRDGLTVHAYLTRPELPAGAPAPMVVLIHGGPNIRDRWGYDREVQVLAAAGYVVFQPQFRGSSGFGRKFEEAGFGQWGRAMQDDITDGVEHLIARGVADRERVCIYGASYGGYAAMWGVIRSPTLYRCGASFAGISDLGEFMSFSFFDDSTAVSREIHRARVGDPDKMRQQLEEVSPLRHAARVGVPLFIAHGERDERVLPSQSKKMVSALRRLDKPVESMWFDDEGHGLYWRKNELRYYEALLNFLDKHLGAKRVEPSLTDSALSASERATVPRP